MVVSSLAVFLRLFLNSAQTTRAFHWFLDVVPVMGDLVVLLIIIV